MSRNPFSFGSMTRDPNKFVGRRAELKEIINKLNGNQTEGCAIIGERRIGKSSLLHYLAYPRHDEPLRLDKALCVVYLSAAAGHCETPEKFRVTLIERVLKKCKPNKLTAQGKSLYELQQKWANGESCEWSSARVALEKLQKLHIHPVICFDEFEGFLRNGFDDRFFNALRNWADEGLLSWVTASAKRLEELKEENDLTSPFFNLLATIDLNGLSDYEVDELLKLAHTTSHPFSEEETRMVKRFAGTNPYHLKVVASRLWNMKKAGQTQKMKAKEKALRQYLCKQPYAPALCSKKRYPPVSWLIIGVLLMIIIILLVLLSWQAPHFVQPVVNSINLWIKAGWKLFNEQGTAVGTLILLLTFITIVFKVVKEKRGVLDSLLEIWKRFIGGN